MSIGRGSWFIILILITMAIVFGMSLSFGALDAALLPAVVSGCVFLLAARELWKSLSQRENKPEAIGKTEPEVGRSARMTIGGWTIAFPLGVYVLGFEFAIPLSIFVHVKMLGRSWAVACAVSATTTLIIYAIFQFAMKIDLWKGLLFQ